MDCFDTLHSLLEPSSFDSTSGGKRIKVYLISSYFFLLIFFWQVVVAGVSTPAAEVQHFLVVPREVVEKVAKDFFKEGLEVDLGLTMRMVDLAEVLVVMDGETVGEEEQEGTLEEAVAIKRKILVEAGEDLTMLVKINETNVAINYLVMVRLT